MAQPGRCELLVSGRVVSGNAQKLKKNGTNHLHSGLSFHNITTHYTRGFLKRLHQPRSYIFIQKSWRERKTYAMSNQDIAQPISTPHTGSLAIYHWTDFEGLFWKKSVQQCVQVLGKPRIKKHPCMLMLFDVYIVLMPFYIFWCTLLNETNTGWKEFKN